MTMGCGRLDFDTQQNCARHRVRRHLERFETMKARTLLILLAPTLSGCVALGLASVEVAAVAAAAVVVGAAATKNTAPPEVKVYGPNNSWLDRNLYNVWVIANAPEEAERIAIETASKSCADRGGLVRIEWSNAAQQLHPFIPIKIARFSYEVRFRCMIEKSDASE